MSKIVIKDNIFRCPIENIHPNEWNPNHQSDFIFEKELKSISDYGFLDPLDVREREGGGYEIVDGEHRWLAAKKLGMTEVPVNNLGNLPRAIAKQLTVIRNETRGKTERTELSELLHGLVEDGIRVDELKANLPIDPVDIDTLLKDLNVDWQNTGNPDESESEEVPKGNERVIFNLPTGLAQRLKSQVDRFKVIANKGKNVGSQEISLVEAMESLVAYLEASSVREPV